MASRILAVCAVLLVLCAASWAAEGQGRQGDIEPQWWPGEGPVVRNSAAGTVTAVTATSITLQTMRGPQTFAVNQQTRIMVRGEKGIIDDVKIGDHAIVKFGPAQGVIRHALGIMIPKPSAAGKITSISSNTFVLQGKEKTWNVTLTPETKIVSHNIPTQPKSPGYIGIPDDLRVGYEAAVRGEIDGDNVTAAVVQFRPTVIRGVVEKANHNEIVVKTLKQRTITVVPKDGTVVFIRPRTAANQVGTWNDIKQDTPINIGGHVTGEGTMEALWVDLLTGGPGPGQGAQMMPGGRRPGRR